MRPGTACISLYRLERGFRTTGDAHGGRLLGKTTHSYETPSTPCCTKRHPPVESAPLIRRLRRPGDRSTKSPLAKARALPGTSGGSLGSRASLCHNLVSTTGNHPLPRPGPNRGRFIGPSRVSSISLQASGPWEHQRAVGPPVPIPFCRCGLKRPDDPRESIETER